VLPLNTLLTAEQYAYILGDSRASAIVASASPLPRTATGKIQRFKLRKMESRLPCLDHGAPASNTAARRNRHATLMGQPHPTHSQQ
jgi:acyl-CoA synthetase (AMP-forming)/AMP-acid ligase II